MSVEDDAEILDGLRRRDPAAFDAAYARHAPRLMRFLTHLVRRRDVAEDLFQETWLKLAAHGAGLAPESDLRAWLFAVARNATLSRRRRDVRLALGVATEELEDGSAGARAPDAAVAGDRLLMALERSLVEVSEADRELLLLVGVEGLSSERAAAVLGTSATAVRQRLHRARARLLAGLEASPDARERHLERRSR